jgi:16S rRNA (guanine966-N2)-methyltransferase
VGNDVTKAGRRTLRIIAGTLKGRRLNTPAWDGLRPTSDKLRETLFNILAPRVAGARVIDAYAGTGALGIEALSRGAAHVVFIERDARAQRLIAENLAHCGIAEGYAIIRESAVRALASLRAEPDARPFEIVLLDPPYEEQAGRVVAAAGEVLAPGGLVVLEHARRRPAPDAAGRLIRSREVAAGDSGLSFFEVGR